MTGCPRRGRGDEGTDCHASDVGHWLAMTATGQSETRRETDCHASVSTGSE